MKKSIISLTLLATLMFGAQYSASLGLINEDIKALNTEALNSLNQLSSSEEELHAYVKKIDKYEAMTVEFTQSMSKDFLSKEEAIDTMNQFDTLSSQSVALAKTVAYLASHQADNTTQSYKDTLTLASKTILQLSSDIGTMADRIVIMADDIGVMADRIVKTQEIQSANLQATNKLAQYAMTLSSQKINQNTLHSNVMHSNLMQSNSMQENSRESMR